MSGKYIKCDNCGEVIIKLAKGSQVKPNIYALHEVCPTGQATGQANGAERYKQQANGGIMGLFRDIGLSV